MISTIIKKLSYPQLLRLLCIVNDELQLRSVFATPQKDDESISNLISDMNQLSIPSTLTSIVSTAKSVLKTEDLGKIFEMSICLLYDTPYDGKYKYSMKDAEIFKERLNPLKTLFPACHHTAKGGSLYDFTSDDKSIHLSAKTTKGDCKIAPQYIGQATPNTFCERIGIPTKTNTELKQYIQENITSILPLLEQYTFSSPIIYYNQKKDSIKYIKKHTAIPWETFTYSWTKSWSNWTNSTTLSIETPTKKISILEIQFHTIRSNMAVRWCFENLMSLILSNIDVHIL